MRRSSAILNSVTQASFAYDGDELRIRKTNATTGAVTHYIYDTGGQLMAEMDAATGNPIREYIWLGALPIGYVDRLGASGASRLFFIHADHLARPQKITDSSRAIVWDGVFAPFGEIHSITGGIVNVLMFPGQIYDSETGLAQNWHRDYDANIGRYLQSDPVGLEGGVNTFAYVGGNPNSRIDLDGTDWTSILRLGEFYQEAHDLRSQLQQGIGGNQFSSLRHCLMSCILASKWGEDLSRAAGYANEIQGWFWHDMWDLGGRLAGTRPWAFSLDDLGDNERGFACARCSATPHAGNAGQCLRCCKQGAMTFAIPFRNAALFLVLLLVSCAPSSSVVNTDVAKIVAAELPGIKIVSITGGFGEGDATDAYYEASVVVEAGGAMKITDGLFKGLSLAEGLNTIKLTLLYQLREGKWVPSVAYFRDRVKQLQQ